MEFLLIPGTVRDGRRSIHAVHELEDRLTDRGHTVTVFDIAEHDVPFLQERRHKTDNPHPAVERFGQLVEAADGIVLVTPEYNHSIPGALKNLIDHLYPEYAGKPFGYVTVSGGPWGGVRLQPHLNEITLTLKAHPGPSLPIRHVRDVFDADGNLVDEDYADRFDDFIEKLTAHTERFVD